MNVLVFQPQKNLDYSYFVKSNHRPICQGRIETYRVCVKERNLLLTELRSALEQCSQAAAFKGPDAIAIRVRFGGEKFTHPTLVDRHVMRELEDLALHAPLHLPPIPILVDCCQEVFHGIPIVLVFDTAFFTQLPQREYLYGLDTDLTRQWSIRRYGFHGLYHEAACVNVLSRVRKSDSPQSKPSKTPCILSICLEPRPELSAVVGRRPLTVTSGATPLEGLPGQTNCGELDSSIILTLSEKMKWNAEKINSALTQQSGLSGLVGKPVSLEEVLTSSADEAQLAKDVLRYRILMTSGMGIAAMGGLDHIVFSGRYAALGRELGPWLSSRLPIDRQTIDQKHGKIWSCFTEPLDYIIAQFASTAVLYESSIAS
jgi:acetate kinase